MMIYKGITKAAIIALGALFVGYIDVGLLEVSDFNSNALFKLLGYALLSGGVTWNFIDEFPTPVKSARPFIEPILDAVSGCLQQMTETTTIRANIFLLENSINIFKQSSVSIMFCSTNMRNARDVKIKLQKYQGLGGHVWGAKQGAVADLAVVQQKGWASWNLTPDQIDATKELKAIFATPIFEPGSRKVIGILSFDCDQEFFRSNPKQKRMVQFFESDQHFLNLVDSTCLLVSTLLIKFKLNRELA